MSSSYQLFRPNVVVNNGEYPGPSAFIGSFASQALVMAAPSVTGDVIVTPGHDWHLTAFLPVQKNSALITSVLQYVTAGGGSGTVANYLGQTL